ncbi:GA-like domain-containing protein [Streptococcus thoraltensis]|uniref:GA-like domain-containing protein n=1 Tax=Streptococcus thoraltensis TaxID=55085 RepID=UPI002A80A74A|nr:YSIRK-type signal peptide-containing protein [Streptococcus thoraltensis]MDY4761812.1 YSIRK-type signal peptide-containing protein [Streptococcus thoraltensis]
MFLKQKQRFSIRKYSFGAASVLLGTVILGMAAPEASADTAQPVTQQIQKEEDTSVASSGLNSPEMEAISETQEMQAQEELVQSTDTSVAEPVVASESSETLAPKPQATRVSSTDTPVAEIAVASETEVPATQVQETLTPSTDTSVVEPAVASESPEVDETSSQEENHPAPSALTSDETDKPRVRSVRSLPDSPADDQNLLEDVQNTLVDKTDLEELVEGNEAFKPTSGYTNVESKGKADNKAEQSDAPVAPETTVKSKDGAADSKSRTDKQASAIARADFYITMTEKTAQKAKDKKAQVEADGAVNPAEKQEVDELNAEVTRSKKLAEQFIATLPENSETKELKARLAKVTTADVTINDANSNGYADTIDGEIARLDNFIKNAEETAQAAEKKKKEVESDKLVTPAEKREVDALNEGVTQTKQLVAAKLDSLPEGKEKSDLKARFDKITTSTVTVNDADSNGKVDADEAAVLRLVKDLLTTTERVVQNAKTKKAEAEADGVVTAEEKAEIDRLNTTITNSQKQLSTAFDNLSGTEIPALKERFAKLTTSEVTVGAVDSQGKADSKEEQVADNTGKVDSKDEQADTPVVADDAANKGGLSDSQKITLDAAKAFTESAEEAAKEAAAKKTQVEQDGTVTSEEKQAVDALNGKVTQAKSSATQLVNSLPDNHDTADLKARLAKVTTSEVTVGAVDSQGKVDSKEEQDIVPVVADDTDRRRLEEVEATVEAIEKMAQIIKAAKQDIESDGVINPAEKASIDGLNKDLTTHKERVASEVDNLPDSPEKSALKDRLDKVTTSTVTVNDADSDGKADSKEEQATDDSGKAESQDEQSTDNNGKADNKDEQSSDNNGKVDSKDEQTVDNDGKVDNKGNQTADNNDEADSQDERDVALIDAQEAVEDAEAPAQFGKENKAEAEKDGVITPSEKEHLDQIDTIITAAKNHAQSLVDKLPDSDAKKALQDRLAKITTSEVTVSEADSDGKADSKDEQAAADNGKAESQDEQNTTPVAGESADSKGKDDKKTQPDANLSQVELAVKAAEDAAQVAKDKKAEVEADGAVNPSEKEVVDELNATVTESKNHAQSLVDNLSDSETKTALKNRLDKVTTSEVVVNDADSDGKADSNGKADSKDEQTADNNGKVDNQAEKDLALTVAEAAVKAAEEAAQFGKEKKAEAEKDGVINPSEKEHLDLSNTITTDSKNHAQSLVDKLPDSEAKTALQDRLAKVTTTEVTVNDADSNGKADDQERLEFAERLVKAAEEAAKAGQDKKAEAEKDGVITPSEKEHLDLSNTITTDAKKRAQFLVDKLPDSDAKKALQDRLDKVTTSEVTVNDADSNGKADDKERLEKAEAAVKSVEALAQSAKDKKTEVESDGVVNPAEKEEVDRLNEKVTVNKEFVTSLIKDNLPDSPEKAAFMDRLAKIMTSEVTVNDADSNGKADSQDKQEAALVAAEAAVKAAEAAAKAGQDKKAEVESDGLVNPLEKTVVDGLNKTTIDKKNVANALVDTLADSAEKEALQARLAKVTTSEVTVNDADSNGKADSQDKQEAALVAAEAAVKAAEAAAKAGQDKKAQVEKDSLVTPAEKTAVDNLNKATADKKSAATALVDKLPDGDAKTALKDRLGKVTPSQVTVNDANSNGKADSLDSIIARADFFVTSTEKTAQAAKAKKAEVEKDGLVTPDEKQAVDSLNAEVTKSKQAAEKFVDTLPEGKEKNEFKARLAKVTTSQVTVNDADSNGKADDQDRLDVAEAAVKAAESAAKAGQDKKAEVEKDGLVNPLEKTVVDGLNKTTIDKKNVASALVDTLADSAEKAALEARLAKVTTSEVTVNDANSNGKADTQDADVATAETAVKAAEAAAKAGQDKKAEVEKDGLVTPAEKTAVDELNKTTVDKKDVANELVEGLSDNAAKTALKERLAKVTTSEVTVNDADSNGKVDSQDTKEAALASAEAAVKSAEAAAKAGQDKKAEVEKDGLVTPAEKTAITDLNKTTVDKKDVATDLVDKLPDSAVKTALKARLAKVTTSEVTVNDADSNGKADEKDRLEVAEAAVKAAESAAKAGQDKKAEVEKDGLVNPLEKTIVDGLNKTTVDKKNVAGALVDTLADSAEKAALEARLAKVTTSEVTVNDADSNGKVDSQEIEKPQVEPKPDDSPKVEKPQVEPKPGDSPKVEKPQVEPKPGDSPKVEKPQVEPKPGDSPKVEKPQVEPKPGDSPKVEKPQMDPKSGGSDGGITGKAGQTVLPTVSKPAARAISSQPVKKMSSTDTVKGENLPRTGERSNQLAPLYGGGMALALAALLASKKRKRNSED